MGLAKMKNNVYFYGTERVYFKSLKVVKVDCFYGINQNEK